MPIIAWLITLQWIFSGDFARAFDDPKNLLFYFGAGCVALAALWRSQIFIPRGKIAILLSLYFVSTLAALYGAGPRYESFAELARLMLWGGLIWSVAQWPVEFFRRGVRLSTISAGLIAGAFLLHYFDRPIFSSPGGTIFAPLGHITYAGDFFAGHIPLAVWCFRNGRSRLSRIGWIATFVLLLTGVWLAGTRASALGLLIGGGVGLWLLWQHRHLPVRQCALLVGSLCIIGLGITLLAPNSLRGESFLQRGTTAAANIFNIVQDPGSVFGPRWNGYRDTWQMIRARPLTGWGLETFRFTFPEFEDHTRALQHSSAAIWYMHPHNEILHQLASVGFPGALCFLLIIIFTYRAGLRNIGSTDPEQREWIILALSGLTIALVSWQLSTNYLMPLTRVLTALYLGTLLRHCIETSTPRFTLARWQRIACSGVTIGLTLVVTAYYGAQYCLTQTRTTPDMARATRWVEWSYRLAPGAYNGTFVYAGMLLAQHSLDRATPLIEQLHHDYPFVAPVLVLTARLRIQEGRTSEAQALLQHALRNDPSFTLAQTTLDSLTPH